MRRGTTPTFEIECDIDLTNQNVYVTIRQGSTELTVEPEVESTETGCVLYITLTQKQTLGFSAGIKAQMQVRAINANGTAVASNIMPIEVGKILLDGELSYE